MFLSCKAVKQHAYGELTNPVHIGAVEKVRERNAVAEVDDQITGVVGNVLRDSRRGVDHHITVHRGLQETLGFGVRHRHRCVTESEVLCQVLNSVTPAYNGRKPVRSMEQELKGHYPPLFPFVQRGFGRCYRV